MRPCVRQILREMQKVLCIQMERAGRLKFFEIVSPQNLSFNFLAVLIVGVDRTGLTGVLHAEMGLECCTSYPDLEFAIVVRSRDTDAPSVKVIGGEIESQGHGWDMVDVRTYSTPTSVSGVASDTANRTSDDDGK